MIRMPTAAPLALLATVALLSGCGSSSSSSSTAATTSTPSTSSSTTAPSKSPDVSAAVAQCKHGVHVLPTLSAATKTRLESICDKAASGDAKAARAASREACEEIVKASQLPEGTARNRALAGCKAAEGK